MFLLACKTMPVTCYASVFGSSKFCAKLAKTGIKTGFINEAIVCGLSADNWSVVNGEIAFAKSADAESVF